MTGLVDNAAGVDKTWVADFTGPGIIIQWGGGGGGASYKNGAYGGRGGGSGALAVDLQSFTSGQTYKYTNGAGGAGASYSTGDDNNSGSDGQASYFGGGTTCRAAGGQGGGLNKTLGAGGSADDCLGRARVPGNNGADSLPSNLFGGGNGGTAPSQGGYAGGAGGVGPGSHAGTPGTSPGGGGSGGAQGTDGAGGAGASGGTVVIQAPDTTLPGRYLIGLDANYNFSAAGTYDDFTPAGNGFAQFEGVGSGGGGRGGNALAGQGGHGASGGAWAARLREVFKDVTYRRTVPAGGAGTALNGSAGANGADAEWTLAPLRVIQKQIASNVATVWTCAAGSSTPQKHGLLVGETAVVSGVDATFNGSVVVTAVSADRLSFSYAKVAGNSGPTAVTPSGTSVTLSVPFLRAKGGLGAVGIYTSGTPVAGGQASACIGDQAADGDRGQVVPSSTTTDGASAGGGALPLGEQGGWGGASPLAAGNAGDPGGIPGGGGGGGRGLTGGNGGNGGQGAAIVRYILELYGIWVGGERQSVVRSTLWLGAPGSEVAHTITERNVWNGGTKHSSHRTMVHPESLKRRYPAYIKGTGYDYTTFFDRVTGTFNWKVGATHLLPAIVANDIDIVVPGDSVSEGWTSFDGLLTGVKDFPKAFPRRGRDLTVAALSGSLAKGGTGAIRTNTVSGVDPQWSISGWSSSGDKHYVTSSTVAHVATFTPGLDSEGIQLVGDKVAVVYSGGGITVKNNAGTVIGTGAATGSNGTLARLEISIAGSPAGHIIKINPTTTTQVCLFTCDVYKNTGIRLHNMGQGGSKAGGGTGQGYWGPASGMTAPGNMTACYSQNKLVKSAKSGVPDAVLIFLGGNDSSAGSDAATIKAAYQRIGEAFDGPNTDIILMPDVWTADRNLALMDLCITKDWAMIDFFYLSRALTSIFGQNYNGDAFGHLNSTRGDGGVPGSTWAGGMVRDALLYDPA